MDLDLRGRRAVVTGGSKGTGLAVAAELAGEGARASYGTGASIDVAGGIGRYV